MTHGQRPEPDKRSDERITGKGRDYGRLQFDINWCKMPYSFVDLLLPALMSNLYGDIGEKTFGAEHFGAQGFRIVTYMWRNTYGRRLQVKSTHRANWESASAAQLGRHFGWQHLDHTKRGLSRAPVAKKLKALTDANLLRSMNPSDVRHYGKDEPNQYGIGRELWQVIGTGDFSWQFRGALNIDLPESTAAGRAGYENPGVDEALWKALKYGRAPLAELRAARIELKGSGRSYLRVKIPEISTHPNADLIEVYWFQFPTCFEDTIAPNVPIQLYPLLVYILRETYGKWQFAIDRTGNEYAMMSEFEKTRVFKSYADIAALLGVSMRKAKYLVKWAKDNGILDVRTRKGWHTTKSTNGYLLGPEILHCFRTGNFTPQYIAKYNVTTKGYPCFLEDACYDSPRQAYEEMQAAQTGAERADAERRLKAMKPAPTKESLADRKRQRELHEDTQDGFDRRELERVMGELGVKEVPST